MVQFLLERKTKGKKIEFKCSEGKLVILESALLAFDIVLSVCQSLSHLSSRE